MMALQPPKSPSAHENEKPAAMPMCYYNLLAGRNQRATGTLSSSPEQAPAAGKYKMINMLHIFNKFLFIIFVYFPAAAGNEEESEVPSRNFLKRQSVLIVDSKSRRKPFRAAPAARRK